MKESLKKKIFALDRIIPIKNVEKVWHEKWYKGRLLLNFPHPFRWIISCKPNVGKTTIILNVIISIQAQDPFKKIILVHGNPNCTEYDILKDIIDIEIEITNTLPNSDKLKGTIKEKTLYIIDDYIVKGGLNKIQKKTLSDIFSNLSTHDNISIIITTQYLKNVPPAVRDLANIFTTSFAKADEVKDLARYVDINWKKYDRINEDFLKTDMHGTLTYDRTKNSPIVYRINFFDELESKKKQT